MFEHDLQRLGHPLSISNTLNQSNITSSASHLVDEDQKGFEQLMRSRRSLIPPAGPHHKNKSSIEFSKKSFISPAETFITRRCMATIKRFRQLLFSINYIVIHKRESEHRNFFELFRQYNSEVFRMLVDRLEKLKFSLRNIQLIRAIYNM